MHFCTNLRRYAEIEERLSAKKDMLDEKELVLSETTQLIEVLPTPNISTAFLYRLTPCQVLRGQATDGREETINTAKIVNDIQARIKTVTRKMIACVSELALYVTCHSHGEKM